MTALLEIEGLDAFYGQAQILEGVDLLMQEEGVAVIGRNGMGKTTLCQAIMGMMPRATGSVRFKGVELLGKPSYKIAGLGIGYVPQGRRLFASLSVDEHLKMLARGTRGKRWTPQAVYDLFPRLAERKRNGGTQLSGGEQQMLAIGRALLGNPELLIMDEPSEGLAPTIVEGMVTTCKRLVEEGMAVLLVE
jgi:branched-chain amino acid transport system ATP-binding protein